MARFNLTIPQDGDYYLAVYGAGGGRYSLAPGYVEEFTAAEWLLIPWAVIPIHLWEGQSPVVVFAPLFVVVIGGLWFFLRYQSKPGLSRDPVTWLIVLSGLLYLGGAAMTGIQVIHAVRLTGYEPAVLVTLLFIAGPLILGIIAVRQGTRPPEPDRSPMSSVAMLVIGVLGLLVWAGLVIGPLLALAAGLVILLRQAGNPGPS